MTIIDVTQYGAKGDGVTIDTQAFINAISANPGKSIFVPDPQVSYVIDTTLTLPNNTSLYGQGKFTTKIIKSGNSDLLALGDGASLQDMWLDGQGSANSTGRGIVIGSINSSDGHQNLNNVRVINFPQEPIFFTDVNSGSQFFAGNSEFSQYNAPPGSNKFSVTMHDAEQLAACPKTFVGCEFNGTPSFNFGGCNDVFISACFLGDLNYTLNSRGVQITNSRLSNQSVLNIYGHNHTITGSDINAQVILTPGVDNCHIGPNSLNRAPVVDNSGNGRNQIYHWSIPYSPNLTSGGTQPILGNGVIKANWCRQGNLVFGNIEFTVGSTTSLGTGDLRFSLPPEAPNNNTVTQTFGNVQTYKSSSYVNNQATPQIPAQTNYVAMIRDTSGSVTSNSPQTWSVGDQIRVSFSYSVGT